MEDLIFLAALLAFLFGLVSGVARRWPVTAPMVFVAIGCLFGPLGLDLFDTNIESELVQVVAEVTLAVILFTDASTIDLKKLRSEFHIPLRLLGVGLPLTMAAGFCLALLLYPEFGPWLAAAMAFILAPTDAALGQAVVANPRVPATVRDSISVESGLNDGIALPPVMVCLAALAAAAAHVIEPGYWARFAALQIALGPIAGAAVGVAGGWLIEHAAARGWMDQSYQRLSAVALALLCYVLAELIGGNGFIAAFFGGLFLTIHSPTVRHRMFEFGEAEGKQLSLFVFLLFGMVLVPATLPFWDARALLYAVLSLTVIRMLPVALSLLGSGLDRTTVAFVGWFGPRGIASVLYLLMFVHQVGVAGYERMLSVIALTVLLSVYAHGLSAVPLSNRYARSRHDEA